MLMAIQAIVMVMNGWLHLHLDAMVRLDVVAKAKLLSSLLHKMTFVVLAYHKRHTFLHL